MEEHDIKQVYIVDDDKFVRESTHLWLSVYGYRPTSFSTPKEFVDRLADLEPGCALLDLRMPVLNGIQILEQYGSQLQHLAIIIMTGHAETDVAKHAIKLGAVDFIEKPFKQNKLIEAIDLAISGLSRRNIDH